MIAQTKKKIAYYICDNLSLFYYRYIFKYSSQMKIMDSDVFYKKYIENVGKYYYDNPAERTNGEFDIVTEDELGYAFYEVKFRKKPVSDEMINEEIEQVKATGLNCYKYVFFSRSGFSCEKRDDVVLIALEEIFK